MRVLIAPDSFKGSAGAADVARALAGGWASIRPGDTVELVPMADGGEGTLDALELAMPGARRMPVTVAGPDGRPVDASWLLLPGEVGVVELASTSGITLLREPDPLGASSRGFGEAIAAALASGVRSLYLAVGGSSSTDGGAGALTALGARFRDSRGGDLPPGGGALRRLAAADLVGLPALPPGGASILCDVTNPLLGPLGAAAVFAPQKGATPEQVAELEGALAVLAGAVEVDPATPGAGAAGGTAFGLLAWGARIRGGSAAVGAMLDLPARLAAADVVITGEGRYDTQSMQGKVPGYVADLARDAGVHCLLAAGSIGTTTDGFSSAVSLLALAGSLDAALAEPLRWLHSAGVELARSV